MRSQKAAGGRAGFAPISGLTLTGSSDIVCWIMACLMMLARAMCSVGRW